MYSELWGKISAALVFVGFNITFMTQFILGTKGMPRRYYNYLDQYQPLHFYSTFGSWILALGFLIMAGYLIYSLFKGPKAEANPWGGLTLGMDNIIAAADREFCRDTGPDTWPVRLRHGSLEIVRR